MLSDIVQKIGKGEESDGSADEVDCSESISRRVL